MNHTDYFTEKIATLPEDLQDAIRASNHEKILKDLQVEYKLHIDQAQILENLATELIFGDIDAPGFVNSMFSEAHVSSSTAGDILLKIDTMILRKIRTYLEDIAESKRKDEELEKLLMSDEESAEDDKANIYAAYYADTANILAETEQQLLDEGILPDGSNITDEMLAKEMGITVEELQKRMQVGAFQEANQKETSGTTSEITKDILTEKEELLHELESPEKSFVTPLFRPVATITTPTQTKTPTIDKIDVITLPDHQLQNIHVEKPYVEEVVPLEKGSTTPTLTPAPTVFVKAEPIVKIPTKIVLSNDPYKEPIE